MWTGRRLGLVLVLALLPLSFSLPQESGSSPTSQAALSAELRQMQTRLNEYASELRRLQQSTATRLTDMSEHSETLSRKLDEAQESQRNLRQSYARLVRTLNTSERELQDSKTTTSQLQSQSKELRKSLDALEKSLRQLRRRMWIERAVITIVSGAIGYAAAEIVDAIR